jgi:hypothetical protein
MLTWQKSTEKMTNAGRKLAKHMTPRIIYGKLLLGLTRELQYVRSVRHKLITSDVQNCALQAFLHAFRSCMG